LSTRVPASERTSQRLRELLRDLPDGEAVSEVMRLGMRKIVEEALEAEVSDALGRGYSERGGDPDRGYRNGRRMGRLKTAEGVVEYAAPIGWSRIARGSGSSSRSAPRPSRSSLWRCTPEGSRRATSSRFSATRPVHALADRGLRGDGTAVGRVRELRHARPLGVGHTLQSSSHLVRVKLTSAPE